MTVAGAATNVTTRRELAVGAGRSPTGEYKDLRTFYGQMESKDQEDVVLKSSGTTTASLKAD